MTSACIRHIAVEFPDDPANFWTMAVQPVVADKSQVGLGQEASEQAEIVKPDVGRARLISCVFRAYLHWPRPHRPGR